jgi:hypothetical protein
MELGEVTRKAYLKLGTVFPHPQDQAVCRPQPIGRHASCANWRGEYYALQLRSIKRREPQRLLVFILLVVTQLWLYFQPRIVTDLRKNSY